MEPAKRYLASFDENPLRRYELSEKGKEKLFEEFPKLSNIPNIQGKTIVYVHSLTAYIAIINALLSFHYSIGKSQNKKTRKTKRRIFVYRGLSESDQVLATLYRRGARPGLEFKYIERLEKNVAASIAQFSNFNDLIAAGVHHSIKTRLLDWSSSPLIATLFALSHPLGEGFNRSSFYLLTAKDKNDFCTLEALPIGGEAAEYLSLTAKYQSAVKRLKELRFDLFALKAKYEPLLKKDSTLGLLNNFANNSIMDNLYHLREYENTPDKIRDLIVRIIGFFLDLFRGTNSDFASAYSDIEEKDFDSDHFPPLAFWREPRNFALTYVVANFVRGKHILLNLPISNKRLQRQRGLFEIQFPEMQEAKPESMTDEAAYFIVIAPRARTEILRYINRCGLNHYLLFDDPQSECYFVNDSVQGDIRLADEQNIEYEEGRIGTLDVECYVRK